MVEQLAVKHKLPLSLEYNTNVGYHINIIIPRGSNMTISDLPAEFIQVIHSLINAEESQLHLTFFAITSGTKEQEILHNDDDGAINIE